MIIFKQVMKRLFQNKIRIVLLLFMPVLFIAMFSMRNDPSLTISITDKDKSVLSKKLVDSLESMDDVKVKAIEEKNIYDKTVSYQTDYSIIIEHGFEDELISGQVPEIKEFYVNEKEKLFYARTYIESFIYNMKLLADGTGYDKVKFISALKEYDSGKLALANESHNKAKTDQSKGAMGFLVQFMLYMSAITGGIILEDKSNGVLYRTFYAPITLKRYLAENLTAFMTVAALQVIVSLTVLKYVFRLELGKNVLDMYLLFLIFSIVCISLGMFVVSLCKKPVHAYLTILLLTTPLVMLGGCYWPMEYMPDIMNRLALFIPTSWMMYGVEKLLYEGKSIMDIKLEVAVLLIFTGIFLAAGLFKKVDISK